MELPDLGDGPLEVILRTAIVYGALVLLLRIGGKRQVGQLSILELVTLLVISDAVQNAMVGGNQTLLGGLLAATTLVALDRGVGRIRDRFPRFRRVIEGEPRLLVRDGVPLRRAMRQEDIEPDELLAAIRAHGLLRPDQVQLAVLETDGSISVIPKPTADTGPSTDEPPPRPTTG